MRLTLDANIGRTALCIRLHVKGHTFGLNVWDVGPYGVRRILWAKHWRPYTAAVGTPYPVEDPFAEPWGDM